jgi:PKHD-type hydroxylase
MSFLINGTRNVSLTNFYIFDRAFSDQEIAKLEEVQAAFAFEDAVILDPTVDIDKIRRSRIKWLRSTHPECHWIFMKFAQMALQANAQMWGFELTGMLEDLQYTVYPSGGGHYDWHLDVGEGLAAQRKISVTLQLSDENDYEGGNLEIFNQTQPVLAPRQKGTAVLFPSYLLHRVSPVIKGERRSLVLWVSGPALR